MNDLISEAAGWRGRELFDAAGKRIGTITGLAYPRKKFGVTWLLVETAAGTILAPAEQFLCSTERLVLPYPKTYVDGGPVMEPGRPLSKTEERRLRMHYGLDTAMPNRSCRQGCGLCQARRREKQLR
ncbi:MAG: hypothetical protein GX113_02970 [Actinobacteria bacterium]|jgi:hypothetical protein|nr:hypothetical protein [Actinomycetota bacterium]